MIFKGELSRYHPADALMLLSQLGLNGVFSVSAKDRILNLSFKDGFLLDAQSGLGDEKILRGLRFQKKIDGDQYNRIRRIQSETSFHVRQILRELNLFPLEEAKQILSTGIQEVLLELFLLDDGTFVFTDMIVDEDGAGIRLDTGAVSLAVLAQADEIRDFEKTNGSLDRGIRAVASRKIPVGLSTAAHVVLRLSSGAQNIRELMKTAPFGSHTIVGVINELLAQGLLTLGPMPDMREQSSESLSFDPLFTTYKQALKRLVRADGILKKVEAVVSFCQHHYDGILILTVKNQHFVHGKIIEMEKDRGIRQQSIKKDLGDVGQEPIFSAVQRSGVGFFGKAFSSPVIDRLVRVHEDWECALLPIVNKPDLGMFLFAYSHIHHAGLSPHHYLELLSWMILQGGGKSTSATIHDGETAEPAGVHASSHEPGTDAIADAESAQTAAAIVARVEELPPLPSLASKSLTMLSDPEISLNDVEAVIARDQALVAKIIKVSNSALYGGLQPVASLRQALARLGARTTKSLVLAASARGYFINQQEGAQVWGRMLWQHAVECGIAARRVAAAADYEDPEQAFISGIMHDIGKVAILMLYPEKFKQIQKVKNSDNLTDVEAELRILQTEHAHIGQLLMGKWHMPEAVRACIEFHHRPADAGVQRRLAFIVSYADLCSHLYGEHPRANAAEADPRIEALADALGLTADDRDSLTKAVQQDFQTSALLTE